MMGNLKKEYVEKTPEPFYQIKIQYYPFVKNIWFPRQMVKRSYPFNSSFFLALFNQI